ncbi:conjugal transfer protein TraE [Galliscardovia ingluviei]|uniref:Conjugal transfer protein TraE n=2 Tax=Galliscardovia ingluviei TaxID=1769422 RepID=A0A8J3AJ62_9BIFI|nr:DUF87 domain-containing protein [Galliscardovia ingluviei]GGI14714.1 conjugal transfer protein TraE [Galliscardovia ingluviei]
MMIFSKRKQQVEKKQAAEHQRPSKTVKQLLGFDSLLRNGIAYLGDDRWSASIVFEDINYQLAPEALQMEIIDRWAKLLNTFTGSQCAQISVFTRSRGVSQAMDDVRFASRGDAFDALREDYNRIVRERLEMASRDSDTIKVLTVGLVEHDRNVAVNALNALCNTLIAQLHAIEGCRAYRLNREQRVRLLSELLRPEEQCVFSERYFDAKHRDVKDYCAPFAIDARKPQELHVTYGVHEYYHRTLWISEYPPELTDQLIQSLSGLQAKVHVSLHLQPFDRETSLETVKRVNAKLKMQEMEQRRKNRKQGLDPDDLPADLADQIEQMSDLKSELQHSNQQLMNTAIVIGVSAESLDELRLVCQKVQSKVKAESCAMETLAFMQPEGLVAELPLANNPLPMRRTLTTNTAAILIPFTAQEVYEPGGIFYGSNARTGNPIVADRRSHMNANGFVLGTSGGGKSFSVKQEIGAMFLNRDDEVIIIDPEREYCALAQAFHGSIIQMSAGSSTRLNPLDIMLDNPLETDPVKEKTNAVTAMIGALIGGDQGLSSVQKSLIDTTVLQLYQDYRNGMITQPTLQELYDRLRHVDNVEVHNVALALQTYVAGSLAGFNGQTNVDSTNRFTVFDVSGLTGGLRTFGMMVVIEHVWNRVVLNKLHGKRTWLYVDEFHRFFSNPYSSAQFKDLFKRARKYGLGVTGITQNIEELLVDNDARLMLSNSDFLMLLSQKPTDADQLCELLDLSDEQRQYFTGVMPGEGLLQIGNAFVPFNARIANDSSLYELYSTEFKDTSTPAVGGKGRV